MEDKKQIVLFQQQKIRRIWDEEQEKWFFSIVDVVAVLTESPNPRSYWKVLKNRLKQEGSEVVTFCNHLKMQASDGKFYKTDSADTEKLFRIIHQFAWNHANSLGPSQIAWSSLCIPAISCPRRFSMIYFC